MGFARCQASGEDSGSSNSYRRGHKESAFIFERYTSTDPDLIDAAGVEKFCHDIGIDACDSAILAFCFLCEAETMGQFTREEFNQGLHRAKAFTIEQIQACVPQWREVFQKATELRPLYRYVFTYILEEGHKQLPVDVALDYWDLLFRSIDLPLKADWFQYVEKVLLPQSKEMKIYRDLWNSIFDFLNTVKVQDAENFNADESAWPTAIDDFVDWMHREGRFSSTS